MYLYLWDLISYPESTGFLVSEWSLGDTLGEVKKFLIGRS